MLGLLGCAGVALSHLMCYASASAPSPDVDYNAVLTVERWFNAKYPFTRFELTEIRSRVVEFFESDELKSTVAYDKVAQHCQSIKSLDFADVGNARCCILEILAENPWLGTRLMRYHANDLTTRIALHKFFRRNLVAPYSPDAEPGRYVTLRAFMHRVIAIPSNIRKMDWSCVKTNERYKFNLVTFLAVQSKWNTDVLEQKFPFFIGKLASYCDDTHLYYRLAEDTVEVLYKLKFLKDKSLCTDIFSKLLSAAYRNSILENARTFEFVHPEDDAAEFLLASLLDLWSAGGVRWDEEAESSRRGALPDFCYKNRQLLARDPMRVVSQLLKTYCPSQPGCGEAEDLSLRCPALIDKIKTWDPKLIYLLYYFGQKQLLFILSPDSFLQDYFDALSGECMIWLLKYSSEETDPAMAMCIDDLLPHMTTMRQQRLYQWAGDYLAVHGRKLGLTRYARLSSLYDYVKIVSDRLEGQPALKRIKKEQD
ncbi:hypothetical protein PAPHI01_0408 [Pancytospora philotis]|nr:hypothetical protein PAPHI01_0408 [Pancytospora philotis]